MPRPLPPSPPFRTLALALALALPSGAAPAACVGENLIAAQPPEVRARMEAAIAQVPYPEGNVWRATAPDGTELTVVGTMHLPDPRQEAQIALLAPLLDRAALLVVEADAGDEAALQARLAGEPGLAFIADGPTLLEQLDPVTWTMLKAQMAERGVPGFMAAKFRPWYAGLVLAVPACAMAEVVAQAPGLDKRLMALAAERGLPVEPLDDVDALLDALAGGTPEEQIEELEFAVRLDLASPDMMATMMDSYFAGRHRESWEFWRHVALGLADADAARLERSVARLEDGLLTGRNLAWIGRIAELTQGRTAMVAVGAAHLAGEKGVLKLLEERGFALARLD